MTPFWNRPRGRLLTEAGVEAARGHEQVLLGSILAQGGLDFFAKARGELEPQDFAVAEHGGLWMALQHYCDRADEQGWDARSAQSPHLEDCYLNATGKSFPERMWRFAQEFSPVTDDGPVEELVKPQLQAVKNWATAARAAFIGRSLQEDAATNPSFQAKSVARVAIDRLTEEVVDWSEPTEGEPFLSSFGEEYLRIQEAGEQIAHTVPLLVPGFDGCEARGLVVVGARPNVGKTTFAVDVATRAAREGQSVVMFSCEETSLEIVSRVVRNTSAAKLVPEKVAVRQLKDLDFTVHDGSQTVESLCSIVKTISIRRNIDLVIVDYLQRLRSERNFESPMQRVSWISNQLKDLSMSHNVVVMALAQINRGGAESPKISDLRDSGQIEQDADSIWLMSEDGDAICVKRGKNRHGPKGEQVLLYLDGENSRFLSWTERGDGDDPIGLAYERAQLDEEVDF